MPAMYSNNWFLKFEVRMLSLPFTAKTVCTLSCVYVLAIGDSKIGSLLNLQKAQHFFYLIFIEKMPQLRG